MLVCCSHCLTDVIGKLYSTKQDKKDGSEIEREEFRSVANPFAKLDSIQCTVAYVSMLPQPRLSRVL